VTEIERLILTNQLVIMNQLAIMRRMRDVCWDSQEAIRIAEADTKAALAQQPASDAPWMAVPYKGV
jgi:hypothetical protein